MTADRLMTPSVSSLPARSPRWRWQRRHVLMLVLAAEVLVLGARGAERYRPPGIAVEQTVTAGHRIT